MTPSAAAAATAPSTLAMLGGEPAVPADLPAGSWPVVPAEAEDAVLGVLRSGRLTATASGEHEVAGLEREWAAFTGVAHCAAVGSGTAALEVALTALDVRGREVVVPALTMNATAQAVLAAGATPVFADIGTDTFTLDPASATDAAGPDTAALLPVHLHGLPADMDELLALGARLDVPVIEDAAQAHGARYRNRTVGALGAAGCFSLHPSKNLPTCGEGGLVTTASQDLHDAVVALRNFGERPPRRTRSYIAHRTAGNARIGPIEAAFTRIQLRALPAHAARRERDVSAFLAHLDGLPGLRVPYVPSDRTHAWHILRFRLAPDEMNLADVGPAAVRNALHRALRAEGVPVSQYQVAPLPAHPAFRSGTAPDEVADRFPNACATVDGSLCLQRRHLGPGSDRLLRAYADAFEKVWEQLPLIQRMARSRAGVDWRHALQEDR